MKSNKTKLGMFTNIYNSKASILGLGKKQNLSQRISLDAFALCLLFFANLLKILFFGHRTHRCAANFALRITK